MYKDIITGIKVAGIYVLLNNKTEYLYDKAFESIINIITVNRTIELEINSIVTDSELALVKVIKKYFPNAKRIACYFHYKQDLLRNIKKYGLYKDSDKDNSNIIINILGKLPFIYKGDMNIIYNLFDELSSKYPKYYNFINQYLNVNKLDYFKDLSLDYNTIPNDCRTNNYLENYNGFIKLKLGKHLDLLKSYSVIR